MLLNYRKPIFVESHKSYMLLKFLQNTYILLEFPKMLHFFS